MGNEVIIHYWINENTENSLDKVPTHNDVTTIIPLAFAEALPDPNSPGHFTFDLGWLTHKSATEAQKLKAAVKALQAKGNTKVLFSIRQNIGLVSKDDTGFVNGMVKAVTEWGVDGVDFDYEPDESVPWVESPTLVGLLQTLRTKLSAVKKDIIFTAPIWRPWLRHLPYLKQVADCVDYVSTMDYDPYPVSSGGPGFDGTLRYLAQYGPVVGWNKLVIGVICQTQPKAFTPLEDVKKFAAWKPPTGSKGGIMLWTYTYDVPVRNLDTVKHTQEGTDQPAGTWAKAMYDNLPK